MIWPPPSRPRWLTALQALVAPPPPPPVAISAEAVHRLTTTLLGSLHVPTVLQAIPGAVAQLCSPPYAVQVYLLTAEQLTSAFTHGPMPVTPRLGEVAAQVATHGEQHWLLHLDETAPGSVITTSLRENDQTVGVLQVYYPHSLATDAVSTQAQAHQLLAGLMAKALAQAQRYTEAERYIQDLSAVLESSETLSGSLQDEALNRAAQQLAHLTHADACFVYELNIQQTTLSAVGLMAKEAAWKRYVIRQPFWLSDQPTLAAVLAEGQPRQVRVETTDTDLEKNALLRVWGLARVVLLPLIASGQTLGLVEIYRRANQDFSEREIVLCRALVQHVASAMNNARLYADVERRVRDLSLISESSETLGRSLQLRSVLTYAARQLTRAAEADACLIAELDAETNTLRHVMRFAERDLWGETALSIDAVSDYATTAKALQTGLPQFIHQETPNVSPAELARLQQLNAQNVMLLPVVAGGQPIGLASIYRLTTRPFTTPEIELCQALTRHVASALINARLFDQTRSELIQRLQAEAALQESEERLRLTIDNAPTGFMVLGPQGQIIQVNRAFCAILGYHSDEVLAQPLVALGEAAEGDNLNTALTQLWQGDLHHYQHDQRYQHKDGHWLDINMNLSVLRDPQGQPLNLIGSIEDITERKQTENRFHAQYTVTGALAETTSLASAAPKILHAIGSLGWDFGELWTVASNTNQLRRVAYWQNPHLALNEFETLLRWQIFAPGEGLPGHVLATREPFWVVDVTRKPDAFVRGPEMAAMGIRCAFGFPIYVQHEVLGAMVFMSHEARSPDLELLRMLTTLGSQIGQFIERKRAEEETRLQNTYLSALRDITLRLLGRLEVNTVLETIASYAGGLLRTPHSCLYLLDEAQVDMQAQVVTGVFANLLQHRVRRGEDLIGRVWVAGTTLAVNDYRVWDGRRPDFGALQLQAMLGVPLRAGESVIGVLCLAYTEPERGFGPKETELINQFARLASLVLDNARLFTTAQQELRERQRAEEALAHKVEELARSNAEQAQLARVAAHDLQVILRQVAVYTQLLTRHSKTHLDAEAQEYIQLTLDGVLQLKEAIDALQAYTQLGQHDFKPVLLDSELALTQVLAGQEERLQTRMAKLSHTTLPVVQADPEQFRQLLYHLIDNALKFNHAAAPEITIRAEQRPRASGGREWVFEVRDNGEGIEPAYFDRIFEIFERLHPREEYPGAGIGLALCKKIVERHGGRIWVESQVGVGSTFFFSLPL